MSTYTHKCLYQQIVDNAYDGIIFADTKGLIRLWNSGAEAIFGYSAEEALGQSLDLIIPERFRARHWEAYYRVMETGVTKYAHEDLLAVPALHKDGSRISIEFRMVLVFDDAGSVLGAAAIIRDVTKRWQQEKELREQIDTLKAKLKELSKMSSHTANSANSK